MSDGFVVTPSMMPMSASAWISFTFPVSTNSFISTSQSFTVYRLPFTVCRSPLAVGRWPLTVHRIAQFADAFDLHRKSIAGFQRTHTRRGPSGDDVTWKQRHHARDERDNLRHRENQLPRVRRLLSLARSEEHTSELQSQSNLVCRLL